MPENNSENNSENNITRGHRAKLMPCQDQEITNQDREIIMLALKHFAGKTSRNHNQPICKAHITLGKDYEQIVKHTYNKI